MNTRIQSNLHVYSQHLFTDFNPPPENEMGSISYMKRPSETVGPVVETTPQSNPFDSAYNFMEDFVAAALIGICAGTGAWLLYVLA